MKDFTTPAKKTFNPALGFISQPEVKSEQEAIYEIVPMKKNPLYIETKSKRFNVLMQPTLHKRLKSLADEKGISLNELIHSTLETYADEEEKRGL